MRELNLPSGRRVFIDKHVAHNFQLTRESSRLSEEDLEIFQSAAEGLRPLYSVSDRQEDVVRQIESDLAEGSDQAIISILVHYLPMLKTLRITDLNVDSSIATMVEHVAAAYADPMRSSGLPFQHLESVSMAHWDSECACLPTWALAFGYIPSVKNFVAMAMGDSGSGPLWDRTDLPLSNIKELLFQHSQFDIRSLEAIIMRIGNLEKFSYESGGATVSFDAFEARNVIQALINFNRTRLSTYIWIMKQRTNMILTMLTLYVL